MIITPEVAAEFGEAVPEWIHTQAADPLKIRMLRNDIGLVR
jgi:hypothetical protein